MKKGVNAILGQHSFAKKAVRNSLKEAIKKGKNPYTGRRFTKAQQEELKKLMKVTK